MVLQGQCMPCIPLLHCKPHPLAFSQLTRSPCLRLSACLACRWARQRCTCLSGCRLCMAMPGTGSLLAAFSGEMKFKISAWSSCHLLLPPSCHALLLRPGAMPEAIRGHLLALLVPACKARVAPFCRMQGNNKASKDAKKLAWVNGRSGRGDRRIYVSTHPHLPCVACPAAAAEADACCRRRSGYSSDYSSCAMPAGELHQRAASWAVVQTGHRPKPGTGCPDNSSSHPKQHAGSKSDQHVHQSGAPSDCRRSCRERLAHCAWWHAGQSRQPHTCCCGCCSCRGGC